MIDISSVLIIVTIISAIAVVALSLYEVRSRSYKRYIRLRREHVEQTEHIQERMQKFDLENVADKSIREFLYVDIARLYSLYSQVFEGINDKVVEERIGQLIKGEAVGLAFRPVSADSQSVDSYRRTESGVLYDHMYNRLEKRLEPALIDANGINLDTVYTTFANSHLVKVTGPSELEDFERLGEFTSHFNELGSAIAYFSMISNAERRIAIQTIQEQMNNRDIPHAQKKNLQSELEVLNNVQVWATNTGLQQDPVLLKNLYILLNMFNPTGYNVTIIPTEPKGIRFRGVLDKKFLRTGTDLLRTSYGGASDNPWTMVGIVTFVPEMPKKEQPQDAPIPEAAQESADSGMYDAYRNLLRNQRNVERSFSESKAGVEIIVSPLAIYREFSISIKASP